MNLFDIIKKIYKKEKLTSEELDGVDNSFNFTLTKWLSYDRETIRGVSRILQYFGRICSKSYLRLLFLSISGRRVVPFIRKPTEGSRSENNKVFEAIKISLRWSDKEYKLQENIIKKVINKKYWSEKLGVK